MPTNASEWLAEATALETGKRVGPNIYVHRSALPEALAVCLEGLVDEATRQKVGYKWNVARLPLKKVGRTRLSLSLLSYPDFDCVAFPALSHAINVGLEDDKQTTRVYSRNRPILHRKELFVAADYPHREAFEATTRSAEEHGLFDLPSNKIGFENYWVEAMKARGLVIRHGLVTKKEGL